jgi:LysR family glycine cleavage system transcriptional activator
MSQLRRLLPSLNALVAFEAVVRCGTFARAAKELGVTSPAVSRTIRRLELHLGVPLFRRTPSGAVITKEGNELFSGVSRSFRDIELAVASVARRKQQTRRPIVLSVSAAFATQWFMPRLAQFQACFPGEEIHFQLINGPLEGSVEGVDVAMRFDPQADDHMRVRPLMSEVLLPICSPEYEFARGDAGILVSAETRVITFSDSKFHWNDLFSSNVAANDANEVLFPDYNLVVQAAALGQGIALGWLNVVSNLVAAGTLVPAFPQAMATGRRCDLVVPRHPHSPVVDDVCDWILDEYRRDISAIRKRHPGIFSALPPDALKEIDTENDTVPAARVGPSQFAYTADRQARR